MTDAGSGRPLAHPTRASVALRSLQIVGTAAHRLAPPAAARVTEGRRGQLPAAIRAACDDLGATYVKLGQVIASAPTLTSDELAAEFRSMLDAGPPVRFSEVARQIEVASGAPLGATFEHVEPTPIGQASLAVVHRGTLLDGREVAIKVLRPGIERTLASDLSILRSLARVAGVAVPAAGDLSSRLLDDLAVQLEHEVDLRNEAAIMARFRSLPQHDDLPLVVVPEPLIELSSRRVLVMDFLEGVPIDDADLDSLGVAAAPLVDQVVKAWMLTALRDGIFHGDVHAGNILVLRDGRVGLIDWGIVGQLDADAHWLLRRFVAGAVGDETAWDDLADHLAAEASAWDRRVDLDRDALRVLLRDHLSAIVNRPFGEFSLAETLQALTAQTGSLRGREPAPRGRSIVGALRRSRQPAPELRVMDGGMLLLAKQLAYFERYGRLHLGDLPVLHDRDFFRRVLDLDEGAPAPAPRSSSRARAGPPDT